MMLVAPIDKSPGLTACVALTNPDVFARDRRDFLSMLYCGENVHFIKIRITKGDRRSNNNMSRAGSIGDGTVWLRK
jgi:hypothetical protein